jgi:hypothetical protein
MRNAIACGLGLGALALLGQSAQAQLLEKKTLGLRRHGGWSRRPTPRRSAITAAAL